MSDDTTDRRREAGVQTLSDPLFESSSSEETPWPETDPQPDDEFWFADGDLILVAGNVEFRVYKEPLLLHSSVLREMLDNQEAELAQNASPQPDRGDCSKLLLSDPPDDVRHFLQGLFAGSVLRVGMIHPSYAELSAQIRLGHKYGVKQMVQSSVDYLQEHFPETTSPIKKWEFKYRFKPPGFQPTHAIGVVNLARLADAHSLLPASLMACALLGQELTKGFTRPDGTQETLSRDDLLRCVVGRAAWTKACTTASHKVFQRTISSDCIRREKCKPVFDKILARLADAENAMFDVTFHTSSAWTSHVNASDPDRVLCPWCYDMVGVWESGRQLEQATELLRRIPEVFGVSVSDSDERRVESKELADSDDED
ncbi:hypothetical protein L226DRAFT_611295 [Lentinus tigrinus ALCF2SS1-7]|uniref:uncharacterized protein n=1 Tax=Lentinus tigrinus ALCF2SS1-7 TaxID=1328758 RepID=UPI0011661F51|nr:hypothetical protein L226DRAFT_611295 [Lentinus tigrinus ALCF2SS1-7]